MTNILIAEDDTQLNEGIRLSLGQEDREFVQCYTLAETRLALNTGKPDLIILDINFPDGSGLELLTQCKAQYPGTKIILLTANNMETDIVVGLESGADDYITKPFSLMVLRARVNVQLRKAAEPIRTEGQLELDFQRMIFRAAGNPVELSKTEQKLLRILVENKGAVLTREQLIDCVWDGEGEFVDGNALTVTMKRLRQKLGEDAAHPQHIKTVYGIGYRFE